MCCEVCVEQLRHAMCVCDRERDGEDEREATIQQYTEMEQQYNSMVKKLKDKVSHYLCV